MNTTPSALVGLTLSGAEARIASLGGSGLKAIREQRRLSRAELAARARITRQSVYHYESGLRSPRGLIALRYIEALGLD